MLERRHEVLWEKQFKQNCYFIKWYFCPDCHTIRNFEEFKVKPGSPQWNKDLQEFEKRQAKLF